MPPVISKLTRPRPSVNRPNQEQGPSQSVLHDDEPLINSENGDSHLAYIISDVISNLKSQKSQFNNKKEKKMQRSLLCVFKKREQKSESNTM